MAVTINGSDGIQTPRTKTGTINLGVVGMRRNMYASTSPQTSQTVTFSCDMHVLSDSSGNLIAKSLSAAISTAVIGIGGFTTAPAVNSWVAVYHIYNASSDLSALIGVPIAMSVAAPEVINPSLLPPGYTYSALAAVLMTSQTASAFRQFTLRDRHVASPMITPIVSYNGVVTTQVADLSNVIPLNIKAADITVNVGGSPSLPPGGWSLYFQLMSIDADTSAGRSELAVLGGGLPTSNPSGVVASGKLWLTATRKVISTTGVPMPAGYTQVSGAYVHGWEF